MVSNEKSLYFRLSETLLLKDFCKCKLYDIYFFLTAYLILTSDPHDGVFCLTIFICAVSSKLCINYGIIFNILN
jgi:hypothetical protein